ncbi:fasciclin-like arabinogalactan protein 1 [Cinnamomum micranthum f. kanehirae]|uniref:Fasciclin-like arabinogalactan protein 1 n=1 Tax=Cinnamomum micranthum f. kanehirae TaxID=337451 RepID=A0A443NET0_9MAGN|nr:fasciclin-like arabinogalactan protein 1 [Cinnamomum micranthum f. kanehirae]
MQLLQSSLFLLLFLTCAAHAHNITRILAKHPEFSTFNHYLTLTHLAPEINSRETITVCAVDNAGMADLLSKHLSIYAIKNVLAFHILLDYFGAKKLHQITNGTALAATMFQATGSAPGSSGFVNITDLKGGKVGFGAEDNGGILDASFVKSVDEIPYNISVIQISNILKSPEAEAPTPAPSQMNFTALMAKKGCKVFADLLTASGAVKTFQDDADGGLTVFCPTDDIMKSFLPKYKNLTADGKASLLLYHGIPVYNSIAMLKSNNGAMNTLATDGGKKYSFTVQNDGEQVTLKTSVVTARITGTVVDEQPLAIYTIDKVLLPKELFKGVEAPAPAPAPEKVADAPKGSKKHVSPPAPEGPDLAPSSDSTAADESSGARLHGGWAMAAGLGLGVLLMN